jgi:hypothetical protein
MQANASAQATRIVKALEHLSSESRRGDRRDRAGSIQCVHACRFLTAVNPGPAFAGAPVSPGRVPDFRDGIPRGSNKSNLSMLPPACRATRGSSPASTPGAEMADFASSCASGFYARRFALENGKSSSDKMNQK